MLGDRAFEAVADDSGRLGASDSLSRTRSFGLFVEPSKLRSMLCSKARGSALMIVSDEGAALL